MIDERVLARQQIGPARPETKCARCGGRTTNKLGTCGPCIKAKVPDMSGMRTVDVGRFLLAAAGELVQRRDDIDALLAKVAAMRAGEPTE